MATKSKVMNVEIPSLAGPQNLRLSLTVTANSTATGGEIVAEADLNIDRPAQAVDGQELLFSVGSQSQTKETDGGRVTSDPFVVGFGNHTVWVRVPGTGLAVSDTVTFREDKKSTKERPTGIFLDSYPPGPASEYDVTVTTPGPNGGIPWSATIMVAGADGENITVEITKADGTVAPRPIIRINTDEYGAYSFRVKTNGPCLIKGRADGTEHDRELRIEGPRKVSPRIVKRSVAEIGEGLPWWQVILNGLLFQWKRQHGGDE